MKWICLQGISTYMHLEKQAQVINKVMKTGMFMRTQESALEFHEDFSWTWGFSTDFFLIITRQADTEIIRSFSVFNMFLSSVGKSKNAALF